MYAFAQVGNCQQNPDTVSEQWNKYKLDQQIECLAKEGGYATGEMSEKYIVLILMLLYLTEVHQ